MSPSGEERPQARREPVWGVIPDVKTCLFC